MYTKENGELNVGKVIKHIVIGLVLTVLVFSSFGIIKAGSVRVKTRLGKVVGIINQGPYLKFPVIEKVYKMDVKTRTINYDKNGKEGDSKDTSELFGASKDLQDVKIGVVVTYHVDPTKAIQIYSQYSSVDNYEVNVIEPMVRQIVKSTSAEFTAEELVTKRSEYSDKVNMILDTQFTEKSSVLEDFSVTNFEFSKAFSDAVELKVTAVQSSEASKNKLEQVKFEAQQTIEKAKAEAEAIRIQAQAITSQGGSDYVKLQWISAWKDGGAKVPNFITSENSSSFIMNIN